MLPESLPKFLHTPCFELTALTEDQTQKIHGCVVDTGFLAYDNNVLINALTNPESIGPEFNNKQGSLYKRIQRFLWKNCGFKFEQHEQGVSDRLEECIQHMIEETLCFPIEVVLGKYMDWPEGKFGDSGACYHLGHQNNVTRRFLNSLPNFRTIQVYKDGKGFGRALMLCNIETEGLHVIYNTYPNHRECKFQSLFATALCASLNANQGGAWNHKTISLTSNSPDSWFYTNGNKGVLIWDQSIAEHSQKAKETKNLVINFGHRPTLRDIPGFVTTCYTCANDIFTYDTQVDLGGRFHKLLLCPTCTKVTECSICHKSVYVLTKEAFNVIDRADVGTTLRNIKSNVDVFVCSECFSKHSNEFKF
jgi:hypothetical protein